MSRPRLLIVGIDGATWKLMRPWIEDGSLPTLADLVRRGSSGQLLSVPNMHSPAAWTSFMTGTNPGKHGIFFFSERAPGSYQLRPINGGRREGKTMWRLLSDGGFRVGVLNVPMTYPAESLGEGFMIAGMDAPRATSARFTHPETLAVEIEQHVRRGVLQTGLISGAIGTDIVRGRYAQAGKTLVERVNLRTAVCDYLLRTRPTDVFAVVYTETDGAQHFFWRFVDPSHPDYRPGEAVRYGAVIRDAYRAIDRGVAGMMARHKPDAVLIVSDHGFGPAFGPQGSMQFLQLLLEALGFMVPLHEGLTENAAPARRSGLHRRILRQILSAAPWVLPQNMRTLLRRVPGVRAVRRSAGYRLDWARSRAFCAGCPGEVFVNLRGREPEGCVEPGVEYERVREEIIAALGRCRDADGRPIIAEIRRREELYHGPHADKAGDLFVRLVDRAITSVSLDGKVIEIPRRLLGRRRVRSGFHRPEGIFILAGAGVRQGAALEGLRLYDVAPTVLYYLGLPVPAALDGRVALEAFAASFTAARAPSYVDDGRQEGGPEVVYSLEEAGAVEERLRDLGYL